MPDDSNDIRRGLIAERRSLLITSFALFFYQQAGLQIEKINILGNEAKLSDPWWIAFALWVLWGYFLVRFYQYFRSTPDMGFSKAFSEQMTKLTTRITFRRFKKRFEKSRAQKGSKYDFQIQSVQLPMTFPKYWSAKLHVGVAQPHENGARWTSDSHQEDFTGYELLGIKARAVTQVLLSTHVATEYFLPFLLALLPVWNPLRRLYLFLVM